MRDGTSKGRLLGATASACEFILLTYMTVAVGAGGCAEPNKLPNKRTRIQATTLTRAQAKLLLAAAGYPNGTTMPFRTGEQRVDVSWEFIPAYKRLKDAGLIALEVTRSPPERVLVYDAELTSEGEKYIANRMDSSHAEMQLCRGEDVTVTDIQIENDGANATVECSQMQTPTAFGEAWDPGGERESCAARDETVRFVLTHRGWQLAK